MVQIDMKMPKCCDDCPCSYDYIYCMVGKDKIDIESSHEKRMDFCPLVEVKDDD